MGYGGPQPPSGTGNHSYKFLFFEYNNPIHVSDVVANLGSQYNHPSNPEYFDRLYKLFSKVSKYHSIHEIGYTQLNFKH